ncbi:MAG: Mu transposase domain-containing protein, partial [Bacteroidota bacterium]
MPVESYELKEFSKLTVQYNHHVFIKADKHYYSVPFQLTGKKVLVSCSYKSVEFFY